MSSKHTTGPWRRLPTPVTHTPGSLIGPWDEDKYYTDRKYRRYVAAVNAAETAEETIANCNLIAAAPDLLEACKAALADIDAGTSLNRDHPCIKQMCAAIARATGKEPKQ